MAMILSAADNRSPKSKAGGERAFFLSAGLLLLATVLWGFGPTFFFTLATPSPRPTMLTDGGPLVRALFVAHGLLFTAWMLLFCAQCGLVAARRTALHRRLGRTAFALVPLIAAMGLAVAVTGLRVGYHPQGHSTAFLAVPLLASLTFPLFAGLGLASRRDPAAHKRWMLLATVALASAAAARIEVVQSNLPDSVDASIVFVPMLALWDWATLRGLHRVTLWGGVAYLAYEVGALPLGESAPWQWVMQVLIG